MTPGSAAATRRRRLPSSLVVLLALVAIAGVWSAFAPRSHAATDVNQQAAIAQGRALYLRGCSSCHGLQAQGGNQAPTLIGVGAAAVDFQVGTGRMPLQHPQAQAERHDVLYSQAQIDQLAAYVASLAPGPAVPNVQPELGDISAGGELFRANCAQCHNFAGAGGALTYGKHAPSLRPASAKQIGEAMRTGPESMPVFGPSEFSDQQVNSIAAYVAQVAHAKDPGGNGIGHLGPIPEGLVVWIVAIGGLVGACLWIGSRKA